MIVDHSNMTDKEVIESLMNSCDKLLAVIDQKEKTINSLLKFIALGAEE